MLFEAELQLLELIMEDEVSWLTGARYQWREKLMALELSLKLYHAHEFRPGYQQSIVEALTSSTPLVRRAKALRFRRAGPIRSC
jgi:hypothetical protein